MLQGPAHEHVLAVRLRRPVPPVPGQEDLRVQDGGREQRAAERSLNIPQQVISK